LNEVVINKGYYTEKQRYSVGNVGQVTSKDIEKQPVQNPLLALQGRVPGIEITQLTGFANSGGCLSLNIVLSQKISNLDQIQIIAYGQTTKRLSTGNVSTVKSSDIEKQPVNNPLLALQGRVPGLFITQSTGLPGCGVTI
jgi:hypothetical protein